MGHLFDKVLLMKAKIHVKDGGWVDAHAEVDRYAGQVKEEIQFRSQARDGGF